MCGICGVLNFNDRLINKDDLINMNQAMELRGPDDSGYLIDNNFGMAMRRLSIIDLSSGKQPISNEDKTIHVISNGEIYNYIELRNQLEKKGHKFSTKTDTEVLVHLYEEYGTDAAEHLNGMFAFCIWDKVKRRLWLVRDRLGIKPLCYQINANGIIFASTLDALTNHPYCNKEIDYDSLLLLLTLGYVPTPKSIWKNIFKLPPGHWLMIENNNVKIEKYWELSPKIRDEVNDQEFFANEIESILIDSIKLHSRSDVPVGTFLSGGLDSSAVTALYCKQTKNPVHTFCMDFDNKDLNEGSYAKIVSDKYNTLHHPHELNISQAIMELDELLPIIDEPMADSAIIPSYLISKLARKEGIVVGLCGAGGDELFGGYYRHYKTKIDLISGKFSFIPLPVMNLFSKLMSSNLIHYSTLAWDKGVGFGIATSGIHLGFFDRIINKKSIFSQAIKLTKQNFSDLYSLENKYGFHYGRMILDINNYLLDNVLALTDKTSMAASIEARVPLLDHRLVEKVFSVSPRVNLGENFYSSKKSFKKSVERILPNEILNRPKAGFNAPINNWIKSGNKVIGGRINNLKHPVLHEIFDQKNISKIWNNQKQRELSAESLFMLYIIDKWFDSHA